MSNTPHTEPTRPEDILARVLVETLSQQHHDLEAGVTMFVQKKGPPEEAERLRERAERHRQLLARMKSELSAAR